MTDAELLALVFEHLTTPARLSSTHEARQNLILSEIRTRETRREVARYTVRVKQRVPFILGECGSGSDYRQVQSAIDLERGDEVIVSRDRPENAIPGRKDRS